MVIPRAFPPAAWSIGSCGLWAPPPVSASTFVIAAVSDVFPWSTCPIVPTLQCGFVRSNFSLAIRLSVSPSCRWRLAAIDVRRKDQFVLLNRDALRAFQYHCVLRDLKGLKAPVRVSVRTGLCCNAARKPARAWLKAIHGRRNWPAHRG